MRKIHAIELPMRHRLPPLKTLPAFEIAADRLSFTAAAGELHVTHGAVSRQIKALEAHLGVALFRRRNRRIELTEAGVAFLPGVRQALHLLETSTAEIAATRRQGALVVSCVATFMMRWLIPRLYAFHAQHRNIDVRLSASHAPVDFASEGIDVAIRVGRAPWPRNVVGTPFLADRIGPVCSPSLLKDGKSLTLSELRRHRLLQSETRAQSWSSWASARGAKIDLVDSQTFEHMYFMLEAAASGLGVGIASHALVEQDLKTGRLVAPFGFTPTGNSYCVLHARQAADNVKIAAFRSWISSTAGR
jgi:LysR family transcriptional regulator, glycine cleavage system transcriptional activator